MGLPVGSMGKTLVGGLGKQKQNVKSENKF